MPTISVFNGIKILMYYREHYPPHFHAERDDEAAEVGIDPIMILFAASPYRAAGLEGDRSDDYPCDKSRGCGTVFA